MKNEAKLWLDYSRENYESANILLKSGLFNPCLQNVQQCVEKALKSLFIERSLILKKTHSIIELKNILEKNGIIIDLTEDECDFLDSIYLPSKYPLCNVLPSFEPNNDLCNKGISIAKSVLASIQEIIK